VCLPAGCDASEVKGMITEDSSQLINFGQYLMGPKFFNYTDESLIQVSVFKEDPKNLDPFRYDSLADFFIGLTILTIILCCLG